MEIDEAIESKSMSERDIANNCEMWLTIHKFCECYGKMKYSVSATHDSGVDGENWLIESIGDEFEEAEWYYDKRSETDDEVYKMLATDELRHGRSTTRLRLMRLIYFEALR